MGKERALGGARGGVPVPRGGAAPPLLLVRSWGQFSPLPPAARRGAIVAQSGRALGAAWGVPRPPLGIGAALRGVGSLERRRGAWRLRRTRAAGLWCAPLALTVALTLRARHHATGAGISYYSAEQQKLKQQGTGAAAGGLEAAGQTAGRARGALYPQRSPHRTRRVRPRGPNESNAMQ